MLFAAGCARPEPADRSPHPLAVSVLADRVGGERLEVVPPASARVWLARVSPTPSHAGVTLPDAEADTLAPDFTPPPLEIDDRLKPPLLRSAPPLAVAPGIGRASVDLEVRVDERGDVSEARWAAGTSDSSAIAAAMSCALGMRFHPALQGGRPIAVWCRQRFDFGAK